MIKGPKAILSSAIANALSEYFLLNPNTNIESNLLKDAKIVLKDVQLKPQRSVLPSSSSSSGGSNVSGDNNHDVTTTTYNGIWNQC